MSQNPHKIIIAVDGPAASGKGTFAKALAERLNYAYLDTGALYRIVALAVLRNGGDPSNATDVAPTLGAIAYPLSAEQLTSPALRTPEVAEAVSQVAVLPEVRAAVRTYQSAFTKTPPDNAAGVVMDGRDIGTVVCPDADVKFYIIASAEERARRRFAEQSPTNPTLTQAEVLHDINERDERDRTRTLSPLKPAGDAHIIDTTHNQPEQTLQIGLGIVEAKRKKKSLNIKAHSP